jgi:hypothetical protein
MERERDLGRHRARAARGGIGLDRGGEATPVCRSGAVGEPQRRDPGPRLGGGGGLELCGGQKVGERVEVVADPDATLRRGLHGGGAAPRERVEDDVAGPAVAGDERVSEGRREAREVRAHRMERVAPEPALRLPFGLDRDPRQLDRKVERELLGCGRWRDRGVERRRAPIGSSEGHATVGSCRTARRRADGPGSVARPPGRSRGYSLIASRRTSTMKIARSNPSRLVPPA